MSETRFEQIQDYLNGELTDTALAEFEAQLKKDPALKAEVELHRDVDIALMDENEIPFLQTLRDAHTNATGSEEEVEISGEKTAPDLQQPRRRILRFAAAAAAVILLLVLFRLSPFFLPSTPLDIAQISEETIGDAPSLVDISRSTKGIPEIIENLVTPDQKIKDGYHAEAIPKLTEIYEQTSDDKAAIVLGYCHLEVKNYDNAIEVFEQLEDKKSDLRDEATWYLVHSYLRKGDIQESKKILQKIILSNNVTPKRREQAENLLNDLEKIN